jgi:Predicted transcriptional regulator with C-terminal CBS domains
MNYNRIAETLKRERKLAGLTQKELAFRSGLSLHFIRNIEQGKPTNRLDKVNEALGLFGYELAPVPKEKDK